MSLKFGLKVWAGNKAYIGPARKLVKAGYCQFIELYVDLKADDTARDAWQVVECPVRLHAPHSYGGFNPASANQEDEKRLVLRKVEEYRRIYRPASIVFHPGIEGRIEESIYHFRWLSQEFPQVFEVGLIENKPKIGIKDEICCGAEPQEIRQIIKEINFGFCLDFGHAICYAAWARIPWQKAVDELLMLKPSLFHLSDGDMTSMKDEHRHFGQGNYDIPAILPKMPEGSFLVIETKHDFPDRLDDFIKDVEYLRHLMKGKK